MRTAERSIFYTLDEKLFALPVVPSLRPPCFNISCLLCVCFVVPSQPPFETDYSREVLWVPSRAYPTVEAISGGLLG